MSTKALSEQEKIDLKNRVRWVIDYICRDFHLTNEKIAKEMGCATSTINSYRRKITLPGRDFGIFLKKYNISTDWLDAGIGEPFPGARDKYPNICGQMTENEKKYAMIKEKVNSEIKEAQDFYSNCKQMNVEDALGKTFEVLKEGSDLSVALYMNIQQFAAALETGEELKKCRNEIATLREEVQKLKQEVNRFTAPSTAGRPDDGSEKEVI